MQIPVIITDNRGYRSMIDWLHVLVVAESVGRDEVLIRLNDGLNYSLNLKMSLDEFNKQVEEQLKPPEPSYIAPDPVAIAHLLNSRPDRINESGDDV